MEVASRIRRIVMTTAIAMGIFILICIAVGIIIAAIPFRIGAKIVARLFIPGIVTITRHTTAVLSMDSPQAPDANALAMLLVDGQVSIQRFRELFQKRVMSLKDSRGRLVYDRLRQYCFDTLGYTFLRREKNFVLKEHVRVYDYRQDLHVSSPCSEESLRKIMGGLVSRGWEEAKSPWEFLLIPNFRSEHGGKTSSGSGMVIVVRAHHSLLDGYALMTLLQTLFDGEEGGSQQKMPPPSLDSSKVTWRELCADLKPLLRPVKFFYDFASMNYEAFAGRTAWSIDGSPTLQYYSTISKPIPVSLIKDVRRKIGGSYFSVLMTAVGRGMTRVMTEAGQSVPRKATCLYPLKKPNHPGVMTNHMTLARTWLDLREESTARRIRSVDENLSRTKNSMAPQFSDFLVSVLGYLPKAIGAPLTAFTSIDTVSISYAPFPDFKFKLEGLSVWDCISAMQPTHVPTGVVVAMFSLNGNQRISAIIDKSIFPSEEIFARLGPYCSEELEKMLDD